MTNDTRSLFMLSAVPDSAGRKPAGHTDYKCMFRHTRFSPRLLLLFPEHALVPDIR